MLTADTRVHVHPFSRQPKGDEIVVGRPETRTFVALPPDGVEILDLLAGGRTVGEVGRIYHQRHGEEPDLESFLGSLEQQGFLVLHGRESSTEQPERVFAAPRRARSHFGWISAQAARIVFNARTVLACCLIMAMAAAAVVIDPSLLPTRSDLLFTHHSTGYLLALSVWAYGTIFLHELGHLVAARATGVEVSLGIGHRLYFLVAEADLTALWSVPKRERYLPILAGCLVDGVSAAMLILLLFALGLSRTPAPLPVLLVAKAAIFGYCLRLLWQCYFFLKTDLYLLLVTVWNCSNLMSDTERFLRHQLSRLTRGTAPFPFDIPSSEMRYVRLYAPLWLLGRVVALVSLFLIVIPLAVRYLRLAFGTLLRGGLLQNPYRSIDSFLTGLLTTAPIMIGLALWTFNLVRRWRSRHEAANGSA